MMADVVLTRATLAAGATCTEYVRAGRGGTVLLLLESDPEDAFPLELIGALAPCCRVIAPAWSVRPPALADHLEEFLEGLGIAQAAVVAGGAFRDAVLEYAASSGRITRVALLVTGEEDAGEVHASATARLAGTRVAVLACRVSGDGDVRLVAEELQAFLG